MIEKRLMSTPTVHPTAAVCRPNVEMIVETCLRSFEAKFPGDRQDYLTPGYAALIEETALRMSKAGAPAVLKRMVIRRLEEL